jgi:threonylcarbamoyladenosine tRNA methylthiotransferase MtaB
MNFYVDSVGCRLNQSEIEKIALQLRAAGNTLVDNPAEADVVIVNTCAVTAEAASDSRQKIRQAVRAGASQVVVTGCWATLEPLAAAALPGVGRVFENSRKDRLVAELLGVPSQDFDLEPMARQPLPGAHQRTRAFIKVQDGCDNFCTFCVTRVVRGKSRSLPHRRILADIHSALAGGTKEVVLSGVNLGSWGRDLDPPSSFCELIRYILKETDVPRLRLSSLEPWDLDEDFFSLWENQRLCRHLHLPLQSGSAGVLRRMARKTTPEGYASLISKARQVVPNMAITTDIMVGFPGESEEEFSESLEFVRQMAFAGGHVFVFSPRPGTAAERMAGRVPSQVCRERSARMRALLAELATHYRERFIGAELTVLWETATAQPDGLWLLEGLTDNYLRVEALADKRLWNSFSRVSLKMQTGDGLSGQIVE